MSEERITLIDEFPAPFNRHIKVHEVCYDNGFRLMRILIREGKRFTTFDLDTDTARKWGKMMLQWVDEG